MTKKNQSIRQTSKLPNALLLALLGTVQFSFADTIERLDVRKDSREPAFAKVLYYYYQNKPYQALTTLLANNELAFNASGTVNIMLGDLYSRYGLTREADAALTRTLNSDVTSSNRNEPWLNYGKLLYRTGQDPLALNFLSKVPSMLTPMQESERVILTSNVLMRNDRQDEALVLLKNFQTVSPYYHKLSKYNYALALLAKSNNQINAEVVTNSKNPRSKVSLDKASEALEILKTIQKESTSVTKANPSDIKDKTKAGSADPTQIEDPEISLTDVQNLEDKIALSTAYLYLQQLQPEKARQTLRAVRLDSPYSNTALLTSAHVYFQLKDYQRAYNFAAELGKRNGADPLVQEGWLLAGRALEEMNSKDTSRYYDTIIPLLKEQFASLTHLKREVNNIDVIKEFPSLDTDPILLSLPDIRRNKEAGIWAFLLDQREILLAIQQIRQTALLETKISSYAARLAKLKQQPNLTHDDTLDIQNTEQLLNRIEQNFTEAKLNDQKVLISRIQPSLDLRQDKVDFYLTEAILSKQRAENRLRDAL